MQLAKVVGRVVCSQRLVDISTMRLLIVQPIDQAQRPLGRALIAADAVNAGQGEVVYVVGGAEATAAMDYPNPLDLAIVGIADSLGIEGRVIPLDEP